MKALYKIFIKLAALFLMYSTTCLAATTLVDTQNYIPDEPTISAAYRLYHDDCWVMGTYMQGCKYSYGGEFVLDKNSTITEMYTLLRGTDQASMSIYSQHSESSMPDDLLFQMMFDVNSPALRIWAGISEMSVTLNKGNYWFVIEAVSIEADLILYSDILLNPLNNYIVDTNNYNDWRSSNFNLSLIIKGHPTGRLQNTNCINRNTNANYNQGISCSE